MKTPTSAELRAMFRQFFTAHSHAEVPSASLIPASDDPTVLFTTAGMQPFVPNLLGAPHAAGRRLFSTQKCVRTPDIDEVGDDTHHTFFEMLGNWSLGDYFKQEAIDLSYDFFVKELEMDPTRFSITIFAGDADAPRDAEAEALWLKKPGITKAQIFEFDKADNFWGPPGRTGPCGPCSEIHFDRGEQFGEFLGPNIDGNQRVVEIWNLVFMELGKDETGAFHQLSQKNVDTGVGLERLLSVLHGTPSTFETDLFTPILEEVATLTGKAYGQHGRAFRIAADHLRAGVFMVADGVLPGNEGRAYVLRRLLRRAVRAMAGMGASSGAAAGVARAVIARYGAEYPELTEHEGLILSTLDAEEESFRATLARGEKLLSQVFAAGNHVSGEEAFRLFDTYGFPLEMTKEAAAERGATVDEQAFEKEMDAAKQRSRDAKKFDRAEGMAELSSLPATAFVGDTGQPHSCAAKVLGVCGNALALDQSPFYAEGGGQVADTGTIAWEGGQMHVADVQKTATNVRVHTGEVTGSPPKTGSKVQAQIDATRRSDIMRHHSAAHLFLRAAKDLLGNEIRQAGSHVDEHRMRLDFTFPRGLSAKEIGQIEAHMMDAALASAATEIEEKPLAQAKGEGAEATFGEKYGDTVRTVRMGDSYELCGGTHVQNTAQVGIAAITKEEGVAAGVRRVEVRCGRALKAYFDEQMALLNAAAATVKADPGTLQARLKKLLQEDADRLQQLRKAETDIARLRAQAMVDGASNGVAVCCGEELTGGVAREMAQAALTAAPAAADLRVAVVITRSGSAFVATAEDGPNAQDILKQLAEHFGGRGGGNPRLASGGGMQGATAEKVLEVLGAG